MSGTKLELAQQIARRVFKRKVIELARCVKACFLDGNGIVTPEAEHAIADWRTFAKLGSHKEHSFLRDLTGRIDPLSLARIEGRREMFNRMIDFLELEPSAVRAFVEVDNGSD